MSGSPVHPAAREVLFLLKGYPRLSETFIAQEIRALEQRGLIIRIVALRRLSARSFSTTSPRRTSNVQASETSPLAAAPSTSVFIPST